MRLRRRKTFWRSLRRRLVAGLTLVAYLVAAVGFPLPAGAARRPGSPPAPCGNQLCGCETADQGPRCCCPAPRPPAEEKAPSASRCPHCARAHAEQPKPAPAKCCQTQARSAGKGKVGVPPSGGCGREDRLKAELQPVRSASEGKNQPVAGAAGACCKKDTAPRACCASHDPKPAADPPAPQPEQPHGGWRWPCGVTGRCCQTSLTLWVSYRAVTSPVSETGWQPSLAPREWLTASAGPVPHLPLTPPDPPPRSPV